MLITSSHLPSRGCWAVHLEVGHCSGPAGGETQKPAGQEKAALLSQAAPGPKEKPPWLGTGALSRGLGAEALHREGASDTKNRAGCDCTELLEPAEPFLGLRGGESWRRGPNHPGPCCLLLQLRGLCGMRTVLMGPEENTPLSGVSKKIPRGKLGQESSLPLLLPLGGPCLQSNALPIPEAGDPAELGAGPQTMALQSPSPQDVMPVETSLNREARPLCPPAGMENHASFP